MMDTRLHRVKWGAGQPRKRTSAKYWREPLKWNARADTFVECGQCGWRGDLAADRTDILSAHCPTCQGTQWKPARRRVFCASLGDVFDNEVPQTWRDDLFELIAKTPNLTWMLLTKRIGNVGNMLPVPFDFDKHFPHVWLGATVCDQKEAARDIRKLLGIPAAKHFLSIEPMLGAIDLVAAGGLWIDAAISDPIKRIINQREAAACYDGESMIDLVIAGGESGVDARPSHPNWFRRLRDQCEAAGVPFFFKQWGEWASGATDLRTGEMAFREYQRYEDWLAKPQWINGGICLDAAGRELKRGSDFKRANEAGQFPVTVMHRVGKEAAGCRLDGRQHLCLPDDDHVQH